MKKIIGLFLLFAKLCYANNCINNQSWSIATQSGSIVLIQDHLKSGADIDEVDPENGNTPLMNAIDSGNIDAVKLLIDTGANINKIVGVSKKGGPNWKKRCALTSALNKPDILKYLLDSGANIQIQLSERKTPLHYAADCLDFETKYESLCILLQYGANPNAVDLNNKTPLHFGIYDEQIALALLDHGADLHAKDDEGWKPFYRVYGPWGGNTSTAYLRKLVNRGATLQEFCPGGGNAIHYCMSGIEFFERLEFLVDELGIDINENSKWADGTPGAPTLFMSALNSQQQREDDFQVLEYLIEKGADLNSIVYHIAGGRKTVMYSVLSYAVQVSKAPKYVIKWLIEHGAK